MEKNKKRVRRGGSDFVTQGSILAVAGIIVRLIGMLYRIPLTNIIGDEGIGYYSSAYTIYSTMLIVSSYSMPVAVSKMIAIRLARGEYRNSVRVLKTALAYATLAGGLMAMVMWFGADTIAGMMNMPYASFALKTLAPTIWIMAYLGVLRGYFQGHGTMIPTAFSQIIEQIINAVISVTAALSLFNYGLKANLVYDTTEYSFAYGAAGGTIGTGAGALAALVVFLLLMLAYRPIMRKQARRDQSRIRETYPQITRIMFFTIVPIVVSSTIYNISTLLDNGVYGQVMGKLGQTETIASTWGIYAGRYHMLFNIPVAIANSLSSSLIPSLSSAAAGGSRREMRTKIDTAVRFSMLIAIPSAAGLMALAEPISNLLFRGMDNTALVRLLWYGSSAVVVFSLSTVTNAVLQGLNHMQRPIINASIALVLHLIFLYVMLAVFHLGIDGVLYANILFALIICILNGISIKNLVAYRQEMKRTFIIPLISSAIMGVLCRLLFFGIYNPLQPVLGPGKSNLIAALIAILAAVLVYGICMLKFGGLNREELENLPKGRMLAGIAAKLHLI